MILTFGNVPLNNGGRESPSDLRIAWRSAIQVSPILRARSVKLHPRDNTVGVVSFRIAYLFNDHGEANEFLRTFKRSLPTQGDLVLASSVTGGVAESRYRNACLESFDGHADGVTVYAQFSFLTEDEE